MAPERGETRRFTSSRVPAVGVFQLMDGAKTAARAAGHQVIDLSVGASDLPPPQEALDTLKEAVDDPSTHSYCLRSGTMPLLEAAVAWYKRRYGTVLDPATEALSLIGSQEGLAHALLAVADPGDIVLLPNVAYPSYFGAIQLAGLQPVYLPLDADFLPVLEQVAPADALRAKVLLLNYPNNPTSATASNEFFQRAINFCLQYDILLIHDNPYVDQVYDGSSAPSPLSLPGGKECALELFSFSKSYHLGGFRIGFALGNKDAIHALESVKGPVDFNQYRGIQRMGIACWSLPEERIRQDTSIFQQRAVALVGALKSIGWQVQMPVACMYIWAKLPAQAGDDDLGFCQRLLASTGVALNPGRCFGPGGHGWVRFALVQSEEILRDCVAKIGGFLQQMAV